MPEGCRSACSSSAGQGRRDRAYRSHHYCYIVTCVNDALAHERLRGILELIDRWGDLYLRRWGKRGNPESPGLAAEVDKGIDEVRARTKLAHDVTAAMGEEELAAKVVEHEEGLVRQPSVYSGSGRDSRGDRDLGSAGGTRRDHGTCRAAARGL